MKLKNVSLEGTNIFKSNNVNDTEKILSIKNWLGRLGIQFTETHTKAEQEMCENIKGLFDTLSENVKATTRWNSTVSTLV